MTKNPNRGGSCLKGEVRTINDGNICKRRRCMKNNGKSPTFKLVSGEETPVGSSASLSGLAPPWRHALVSGSHLDPKMTGNSGSGAVRAGKRRAWAWKLLFRLRLTSIGWDMPDSEETIWDPISSLGRIMPPSDFVLDSSRSSFSQTKKNWPERLLPRPSTLQTLTHNYVKFIFLRTSLLIPVTFFRVVTIVCFTWGVEREIPCDGIRWRWWKSFYFVEIYTSRSGHGESLPL